MRNSHGRRGRRPDKKARRVEVAEANLRRWRDLSLKQQLAELDRRLGKGQGATKQRARIKTAMRRGLA